MGGIPGHGLSASLLGEPVHKPSAHEPVHPAEQCMAQSLPKILAHALYLTIQSALISPASARHEDALHTSKTYGVDDLDRHAALQTADHCTCCIEHGIGVRPASMCTIDGLRKHAAAKYTHS